MDFALHDQHIHSSFSSDSKQELSFYIDKAIELGCKYYITTDHLDFNICNSHIDWVADYKEQRKYLDFLKKTKYKDNDIELLLGIEVGYKAKDNLDYQKRINKILKDNDFDLINLSVHDYKDVDFYFYDNYEKYGLDEIMKIYFNMELDAINEMDFDCLCHIDYAFKTIKMNNNDVKIDKYEDYLIRIFKSLIEKDKALEINTKVQEAINDDEHVRYLLRLYKKCGGKLLTLSSDAHELKRYESNFDYYKQIIKEEGFDYLCYFVKRKRYLYKI